MKKGNTMSTESSTSTSDSGSITSNTSKGSEQSRGPAEGARDQVDSALKNMNANTPHMGTGSVGAMGEEGKEVKVFDKRSQHHDGSAANSKGNTEGEGSSSSKFETLKESASTVSDKACNSMKGMKRFVR